MAQQSVLLGNKLKHNRVESDEIEADEIQMPQRRSIFDSIYEVAEKCASTNLGQFVTERGDRVLKVIENTAKWSLPQDDTDCDLERPLSWVPFLTLIIVLRLARFWLSVGAMLIGNGPVTPQNMVYFIQTRRRKLRALRLHGAKAIRRRELELCALKTMSESNSKGVIYKLRNLLSLAVCRPGKQRDTERRIFLQHGKVLDESAQYERQSSKRPRDDSLNDHNLTIDQMLAKYANADSDDDSDFIPNPEEETNDDDDDATTSNDSDDESSEMSDEDGNMETPATEHARTKKADKSVEIVENGIKRSAMPKPLKEIKKELQSDADSMNDETQTPKETKKQMGNGIDRQHSDATATKANNNNNSKSSNLTNGYETKQQSAKANTTDAATIPKQSLALNTTATAGSPTNFNDCLATHINDTNKTTSTSTPTAAENETYDSFAAVPSTTAQQHQQQLPMYQKQQSYYYNQRYRGKNRRY